MVTEDESFQKYLEIVGAALDNTKVKLSEIGDVESAWSTDRRNEQLKTLREMVDVIPRDCPGCMSEKLLMISSYFQTIATWDNLHPGNDVFVDRVDAALNDPASEAYVLIQKWKADQNNG